MPLGYQALADGYGYDIADACLYIRYIYIGWTDNILSYGIIGLLGAQRAFRSFAHSCPYILSDPPFSKWTRMSIFTPYVVKTYGAAASRPSPTWSMNSDMDGLASSVHPNMNYSNAIELESENLVHCQHYHMLTPYDTVVCLWPLMTSYITVNDYSNPSPLTDDSNRFCALLANNTAINSYVDYAALPTNSFTVTSGVGPDHVISSSTYVTNPDYN